MNEFGYMVCKYCGRAVADLVMEAIWAYNIGNNVVDECFKDTPHDYVSRRYYMKRMARLAKELPLRRVV